MPDFDPITVAPPAIPAHDREIARRLVFVADAAGNFEYVQLHYDEYKDDGTMVAKRKGLRQYAGARAFLTAFKANPKQAVSDWLTAKTNETP